MGVSRLSSHAHHKPQVLQKIWKQEKGLCRAGAFSPPAIQEG